MLTPVLTGVDIEEVLSQVYVLFVICLCMQNITFVKYY